MSLTFIIHSVNFCLWKPIFFKVAVARPRLTGQVVHTKIVYNILHNHFIFYNEIKSC